MAMLRRDLRLIGNTILLAHPVGHVSLTHLTKETASLLLDQPPPFLSSLKRRFTIHGAETISFIPEIFQKPSPIDGSVSKIAEQIGCYKVASQSNRKSVYSLVNFVQLGDLVTDEYLYKQEAILLGRLSLTDKILLAGHRTYDMTMDSYNAVSCLLLNNLDRLRMLISSKRVDCLETAVNKVCECSHELLLKVNYYPKLIHALKIKLDAYPTIAAALLASTLSENQPISAKNIARAKVIERGVHLLRSLLAFKGYYSNRSTNIEIEEIRFKQCCKNENIETPTGNFTTNPIILIDFLKDLLLFEQYWEVVPVKPNA
jgi:hypothetical protein